MPKLGIPELMIAIVLYLIAAALVAATTGAFGLAATGAGIAASTEQTTIDLGELGNVTVDSFQGLLVDYCRERDIPVVVKGLRAVSDFDYELQMAQMNASLAEEVETVFVPTAPEYSFLASSLVKEVATFGGDVSGLVPGHVLDRLKVKLAERRSADA